jgi:hypothetical protein
MNCREFATQVTELAKPPAMRRMIKLTAAQEALAHAESCDTCAVLMAEQRSLSQHLEQYGRSTASQDVSREASLRIEATLRSAFRQHQLVHEPARVLSAAPLPQRSSMQWVAAAAAFFLVSAAGYIMQRKTLQPSTTIRPAAVATMELPHGDATATVPAPSPHPAVIGEVPQQVASPIRPPRAAASRSSAVSAGQASASGRTMLAESGNRTEEFASDAAAYETTSEFVPLLYGGDPMLAGSGPVVRVEMSGAVLQTLGFPFVEEPSARRVKADLMLGEDGVARAIRFVQ